MCRQEPHEAQQRQVQSPKVGRKEPVLQEKLPGHSLAAQPPWHHGRQTLSQAEREPAPCPCQGQSQQPLGCTGNSTACRSGKGSLPDSALQRPSLSARNCSVLPRTRETQTHSSESSKGPRGGEGTGGSCM